MYEAKKNGRTLFRFQPIRTKNGKRSYMSKYVTSDNIKPCNDIRAVYLINLAKQMARQMAQQEKENEAKGQSSNTSMA